MTSSTLTRRRAFTLVEMMIVVGVIGLALSVTLPGFYAIFSAGADAQAHNQLSAQMMLARAMAIQESTYACVHAQLAYSSGDINPDLADVQYTAVLLKRNVADEGQTPEMRYVLEEGFIPQRVPGNMAFGEISDTFVSGTPAVYKGMNRGDLEDFTSFSIAFSPNGTAVREVIEFGEGQPMFQEQSPQVLWSPALAESGIESSVTAVTMFRFDQLAPLSSSERATFLNQNGQLMPINVYTGQLFRRF